MRLDIPILSFVALLVPQPVSVHMPTTIKQPSANIFTTDFMTKLLVILGNKKVVDVPPETFLRPYDCSLSIYWMPRTDLGYTTASRRAHASTTAARSSIVR